MKFSTKDFFSKRDQTRSFLRVLSHLLKTSLLDNFIFCSLDLSHMTLTTRVKLGKGGGDLGKCWVILILEKRGMHLYPDNRYSKIHKGLCLLCMKLTFGSFHMKSTKKNWDFHSTPSCSPERYTLLKTFEFELTLIFSGWRDRCFKSYGQLKFLHAKL